MFENEKMKGMKPGSKSKCILSAESTAVRSHKWAKKIRVGIPEFSARIITSEN